MVDVFAEDNGLAVGVSANEVINDLLGHALGALVEYEDALDRAGLPQPPDNLERRVRFARARGHHQQYAPLTTGNGFDGALDSDALVVAWFLTTAVIVIGHTDQLLGLVRQPLPGPVAAP